MFLLEGVFYVTALPLNVDFRHVGKVFYHSGLETCKLSVWKLLENTFWKTMG